jgi:hypothetical protein
MEPTTMIDRAKLHDAAQSIKWFEPRIRGFLAMGEVIMAGPYKLCLDDLDSGVTQMIRDQQATPNVFSGGQTFTVTYSSGAVPTSENTRSVRARVAAVLAKIDLLNQSI